MNMQSQLNNSEFVEQLLSNKQRLIQYADSINTSYQLLHAILLECNNAGDVIENGMTISMEENVSARVRNMYALDGTHEEIDFENVCFYILCNNEFYMNIKEDE